MYYYIDTTQQDGSYQIERPFACQEEPCSTDSVTISLLSSVIVITGYSPGDNNIFICLQ